MIEVCLKRQSRNVVCLLVKVRGDLQIKGYVDPDKNPFINLKIPGNKKMMLSKESREEFSIEEINQLQVEIKKKSNIYPELNHLFQIAIYTGARIEEICKISKDDIKSKVIKIANSKTQTMAFVKKQIHDELISLIKELQSSSSGKYLIDNLVPNKFGQRSAYIGKRFGRLKKRLDLEPLHFSTNKKDCYNTIRTGRRA